MDKRVGGAKEKDEEDKDAIEKDFPVQSTVNILINRNHRCEDVVIDNDYEDNNVDNEIVGSLPTTSANPPSNRCSKLLKGCSEDQAAMDEEEEATA